MATTSKRRLNKPDRLDNVNVVTALNNNFENLDDAVPDSRKVNGKDLSSDVTLGIDDIPNLEETLEDRNSAFDEEKIRTSSGYRKRLMDTLTWVSGGINSSTGGNTTNSKRIKASVQGSCDEILVHCAIPMRIAVFAYTRDRTTGDYVGVLQALTLPDTEGNVIVKASHGLMHVVMAAYPTDEDISTSAAENISVYKCFQPKFENEESAIFGNASDSTVINGNMLRWRRGNIMEDGAEAPTNEYCIYTMDYIPVTPGRIIKFTGTTQTLCSIALYDEEKEFLRRANLLENDYTVESGVAFVRFAYGNTTTSGIKITDGVDTLNMFQVTVINNTFAQYLERIGYLPFVVVKGIYRSNGLINKNSDGICQKTPFQLKVGSTIRVNISGNWIYSVWQGDAANNLTKTDRLVNYDEVEVQYEYVAFCFYKLDENGDVINATPDDFNQNVMLFNSGNTTKRDTEMHDIPENIGVLNVINRAYQMAKLTYTPVANLPTQVNTTKYPGYVPSGTKVTGVMYSSVRNEALYVPQCVSLDTYMTALLNPNSYIYTKTEPSPHYNALTYYGAVCSSMVGWCYGIDSVIPTTVSFDNYDGMEVIENQSPYGLKLGDMLNRSDHHIVIITDIVRNNRGIISKIEVSEQVSSSSHPMTRRQYLTPTQIQSSYFNIGYVAYRYHYIYKVPYTASPWVNLDDEAEEPTWNLNLSPRRGDKANWRPGETIEIDVTDAEEYTGVKLYKGNELQETITIPSGNLIRYVGLDAGAYKVCLTDGTNDSDFAYFNIIDTDITYTALGNNAVRVEYSSENGTPASISFCDSKSSDSDYKAVRGFHVLTDAEIAAGEAVVTAPTTETRSTWLMKVMFKTPFGLYSSDLEPVEVS